MHILTQKLRPGKNDFLKVFQQSGSHGGAATEAQYSETGSI